ncbi:hypothetical protein GCM10023324_00380 [Streptomyces youssoufiensis]
MGRGAGRAMPRRAPARPTIPGREGRGGKGRPTGRFRVAVTKPSDVAIEYVTRREQSPLSSRADRITVSLIHEDES